MVRVGGRRALYVSECSETVWICHSHVLAPLVIAEPSPSGAAGAGGTFGCQQRVAEGVARPHMLRRSVDGLNPPPRAVIRSNFRCDRFPMPCRLELVCTHAIGLENCEPTSGYSRSTVESEVLTLPPDGFLFLKAFDWTEAGQRTNEMVVKG